MEKFTLVLSTFYSLMFIVQIIHSIEELVTGFHKKWFFFKMSFKFFLIFEILHNFFWFIVLISNNFPYRNYFLAFFLLLMFIQSLWHLAWWAMKKEYVPGLITAFVHIILFIIFYFQVLF